MTNKPRRRMPRPVIPALILGFAILVFSSGSAIGQSGSPTATASGSAGTTGASGNASAGTTSYSTAGSDPFMQDPCVSVGAGSGGGGGGSGNSTSDPNMTTSTSAGANSTNSTNTSSPSPTSSSATMNPAQSIIYEITHSSSSAPPTTTSGGANSTNSTNTTSPSATGNATGGATGGAGGTAAASPCPSDTEGNMTDESGTDDGEGRGIPNIGLPMLVIGLAGLLVLTRVRREDDEP